MTEHRERAGPFEQNTVKPPRSISAPQGVLSVTRTLAVVALLAALPITQADTLYVSFQNSDTIRKYSPDGMGSFFATTGLTDPNGLRANPRGLAFDAAGNLYVANTDNNTIARFTPDGAGSLFASTGSSEAYGLAVDSADNLYAAVYDQHKIMKFTPDGVGSVFASTGADAPTFLAVIPEPSALVLLTLGLLTLPAFCRQEV